MAACMGAGKSEQSPKGILKDADTRCKSLRESTLRSRMAGTEMTDISLPSPAVVVSKHASDDDHFKSLTTPVRYSSVSTTASSAFGTRPAGSRNYSQQEDHDEDRDILPDWTRALYGNGVQSSPSFGQDNGSSDLLSCPSPALSRSTAPTTPSLSVSASSPPSSTPSPPFFNYSVCGGLSPFDKLRQGSIASTSISPNTSRENFSFSSSSNNQRKDGFPDFDSSFPPNASGYRMPELMIHDEDQIAPLSPGLSALKSCGSSVARSTASSARNSRTVSFAPTAETLAIASIIAPKPRPNGPPTVSISVGELESEFGRDPTRAGAYTRTILMYLVLLNPVICFSNALFTMALLTYLILTYPFYLIGLLFRRSPNPNLDMNNSVDSTTSTKSTTSNLGKNKAPRPEPTGHFSPSINRHLSTLLFLHIRIIYQTSRPAPPPSAWKAGRLVYVHLVSPLYSFVPYGVMAWVAFAMWGIATMRNRAAQEDEENRSNRGGYIWDWEAGRQEREFWALRRVRKKWEAVLLTTLH